MFSLLFALMAAAMSAPLKICVPGYGEVPGTAALFIARDLRYFARAKIDAELKSARDGVCDAGLMGLDEFELLPAAKRAKWTPLSYVVPGFEGPPRFVFRLPSAGPIAHFAGARIRVGSAAEARALGTHFASLGLPAPLLRIEHDPSVAIRQLETGEIAAAVIHDPFAAALLASKRYGRLPINAPGLDDRRSLRTPTAVFYAASDDAGLSEAIFSAFAYADLNPSQTFRFVAEGAKLLGLKKPLDLKFREAYAGPNFGAPVLRRVYDTKEYRRDLELLRLAHPQSARRFEAVAPLRK